MLATPLPSSGRCAKPAFTLKGPRAAGARGIQVGVRVTANVSSVPVFETLPPAPGAPQDTVVQASLYPFYR